MTPRPHVLLTFYDLGLGGIQTKIISLAHILVRRNVKVSLLLGHRTSFDRTNELPPQVRVYTVPSVFPAFLGRRYFYALYLFLVFLRPSVAFLSLEHMSSNILLMLRYLPLSSSRIVVNMDLYLKPVQRLSNARLAALFHQAFMVLAVSHDVFRDLKKRVGLDTPPLIHIPNWTDIPPQLLTSSKNIECVFAGRFDAQKQPLLYPRFIRLLKDKAVHVSLHMYGSGSLEQELQTSIHSLNVQKEVHIYPPSHNLSSILQKAKFLLLFSDYEGLPFVALEAMKYGCVLVVLDRPGMRDIIIPGTTGLQAQSIEELVPLFCQLRQNSKLYHRYQRNAFRLLQKRFSVQNGEKLADILCLS